MLGSAKADSAQSVVVKLIRRIRGPSREQARTSVGQVLEYEQTRGGKGDKPTPGGHIMIRVLMRYSFTMTMSTCSCLPLHEPLEEIKAVGIALQLKSLACRSVLPA
jgi:hypothetical protein